ncbi:MAG: hypothetical protein AB7H90_00965 [Alphaproteobacteria bacterium]
MPRPPARIPREIPKVIRKPNLRVRPQHEAFVRQLPCVVCLRTPAQCAHVRTGTGGGTGLKPDSRFTVPLCAEHHREQHDLGELGFWTDLGIDPVSVALRLWTVTGDVEAGNRTVERARTAISLHQKHNRKG